MGSIKLTNGSGSSTFTSATSGTLSYTLPSSYGSANDFLQSDGSGGLTWAAAAGGGGGGATSLNGLSDCEVSGSDSSSVYIGLAPANNTSSALNNMGLGTGNMFSKLTSGSKNIAIGHDAGRKITTGSTHIAIGYGALGNQHNWTSDNNITNTGDTQGIVAIGYEACAGTTGEANIGIGPRALYRGTTGTNSVAIGSEAAYGNDGNNVITNCVCIGSAAGKDMRQTGTSNTFIGAFSGVNSDAFGGYLSGDEALPNLSNDLKSYFYANGTKNTCRSICRD